MHLGDGGGNGGDSTNIKFVKTAQLELLQPVGVILDGMSPTDRARLSHPPCQGNDQDEYLLETYFALTDQPSETFRAAAALSEVYLTLGILFLPGHEVMFPASAQLSYAGLQFENATKFVPMAYFVSRIAKHAGITETAAHAFMCALYAALRDGRMRLDGFACEHVVFPETHGPTHSDAAEHVRIMERETE